MSSFAVEVKNKITTIRTVEIPKCEEEMEKCIRQHNHHVAGVKTFSERLDAMRANGQTCQQTVDFVTMNKNMAANVEQFIFDLHTEIHEKRKEVRRLQNAVNIVMPLALGLHKRLGEKSIINRLDAETVRMILQQWV